jgi:aspartyl-tRNA(Asn)/glutamyl-tRNA(Gln) amidotransferase subunit A
LIAYASSFDQIGPLTNNVEDTALLLEIIAGADDFDSTASRKNVDEYSSHLNFSGNAKIAFLSDCIEHEGIDKEVSGKIISLAELLRKKGHTVEAASFPFIDYMVPAYYVLTTAEASSNLSRFSGVLYGHRSKEAKEVEDTFRKSRSEGFGKEVQRRIMLGTFVLSAGYYDAYYSHAQKIRRVLTEKTNAILEHNDFILLPTTPKTAFRFGDNKDPVSMYLEDIFTVQANLTGLPAISLPLGKHSNGMPFGVQLIGKKFGEKNMLAFSKYLMDEFNGSQ